MLYILLDYIALAYASLVAGVFYWVNRHRRPEKPAPEEMNYD